MKETQRLMETVRNTISALVQDCRNMRQLKQIHTRILTCPNLSKNDQYFLVTRLLFFCAISDWGSLSYAADVFRLIKNPNTSICNIMIRAYASKINGGDTENTHSSCQSLILYKQMLCDGIAPDFLTFPFLVKECTRRLDGDTGRSIHGQAIKFGFQNDMETLGVKPNQVTFVGLLSACAHSGLVEKGRWCFDMMRRAYSIEPQVYHYACMVDILGRAGLYGEAEGLIRSMPMEPDVFVWGALLGGCQMHGNVELGERVAQYLIDLEPLNYAFYMNLCDLYAKANKFDDVKRIRALMKEKGIKKEVPGCSMIEVDGVVREFSVRGSPEVLMEEVVWILNGFSSMMKIEG
ncbi:pentatricopeptide repeat-containing protein At5g66520-like [Fagus crenata]